MGTMMSTTWEALIEYWEFFPNDPDFCQFDCAVPFGPLPQADLGEPKWLAILGRAVSSRGSEALAPASPWVPDSFLEAANSEDVFSIVWRDLGRVLETHGTSPADMPLMLGLVCNTLYFLDKEIGEGKARLLLRAPGLGSHAAPSASERSDDGD